MVDVVEPLGAVQIDDQVGAGATHAVADREMIVALVRRRRRDFEFGFSCFRSGGAWSPQALHRSQEGILCHASSPTRDMNPRCRRTGAAECECRPISPREPTNSGNFPT